MYENIQTAKPVTTICRQYKKMFSADYGNRHTQHRTKRSAAAPTLPSTECELVSKNYIRKIPKSTYDNILNADLRYANKHLSLNQFALPTSIHKFKNLLHTSINFHLSKQAFNIFNIHVTAICASYITLVGSSGDKENCYS